MRSIAVVALLAALFAVALVGAPVASRAGAVAPASAPVSTDPGCALMRIVDPVTGESVWHIVCGGHISGLGDGGPGGGTHDPRIVYPLSQDGPGGQPCVYLARVTLITGWDYDPPDVVLRNYLAAGVPWCPGFEPVTASDWVADWWRDQVLPAPLPEIAPGRMIVGWTSYLEAHAPTTLVLASPHTPFGALRVDATATFDVDWGDGTSNGPYDVAGAAWPDGTITHVYERRGTYDVVVTQRWTATWSLGPERGTLAEAATTATIEDFAVDEVQAIGR